jgi:hypothetical protein
MIGGGTSRQGNKHRVDAGISRYLQRGLTRWMSAWAVMYTSLHRVPGRTRACVRACVHICGMKRGIQNTIFTRLFNESWNNIIIIIVFLRSVHRLLVTANVVPSLHIHVTVMMEAVRSSETPDLTRATRRNIPEEGILQLWNKFNQNGNNTKTQTQKGIWWMSSSGI